MNKGIVGRTLLWASVGVLLAGRSMADDAGSPTTGASPQPTASQLEEVTITAAKIRSLEQFTPTGSRLGLSEQELPATLDVIDNDEMIGRGFYNVQEAADSQPGVTRAVRPAISHNSRCAGSPVIRSRRCVTGSTSARPT